MALVIHSNILSHGIYTSEFSSTSLDSPSCLLLYYRLFSVIKSILWPVAHHRLWVPLLKAWWEKDEKQQKTPTLRPETLCMWGERLTGLPRWTKQFLAQPYVQPTVCVWKWKDFPAELDKAIYHSEKIIIKEGASQSYFITRSHVLQFASGHEKGQSRTLWGGTGERY